MALTEISAHTEEKTAPGVHGESRSRCLWAADCMRYACLVRRHQEISMMSLLIVSKGSCAPRCSQLVLRHPTVTCLCFPGVPSQSCFSQEGLHKPANPNHTCFRFLCISHQRCMWCVWGGEGQREGEKALWETLLSCSHGEPRPIPWSFLCLPQATICNFVATESSSTFSVPNLGTSAGNELDAWSCEPRCEAMASTLLFSQLVLLDLWDTI